MEQYQVEQAGWARLNPIWIGELIPGYRRPRAPAEPIILQAIEQAYRRMAELEREAFEARCKIGFAVGYYEMGAEGHHHRRGEVLGRLDGKLIARCDCGCRELFEIGSFGS